MLSTSREMPQLSFAVRRHKNIADIKICNNTKQTKDGEWEFETYELYVPWKEGIEQEVFQNFDAWIECAIRNEEKIKINLSGKVEEIIKILDKS